MFFVVVGLWLDLSTATRLELGNNCDLSSLFKYISLEITGFYCNLDLLAKLCSQRIFNLFIFSWVELYLGYPGTCFPFLLFNSMGIIEHIQGGKILINGLVK